MIPRAMNHLALASTLVALVLAHLSGRAVLNSVKAPAQALHHLLLELPGGQQVKHLLLLLQF